MCEQQLQTTDTDEQTDTLRNCDVPTPDLNTRAQQLEQRLTDLDAHTIEQSLAVAREIFARDPTELNGFALAGAVMLAESAVEELSADSKPFALDGDIHYRHTSFAPGRKLKLFIQQLLQAEKLAMDQRSDLLRPLLEAIRSADTGDN